MIAISWQDLLASTLGILWSLAAETVWAWVKTLNPWQKFGLLLVVNLASGLGLYLFFNWGALAWDGVLQVLWLAFLNFMSTQGTHMVEKFKLKVRQFIKLCNKKAPH